MNKDNKVELKWGERDWYWLIGILISIIILLVASIFAKDIGVEVNFSIISSAVSIALALVAIYIASKQDTENRRVNDLTSRLLNGIDNKLINVDEKVKSIDEKVISGITTQAIEELNSEEVGKESYSRDEVKEMIKALSEDIKIKVNEDLDLKNQYIKYYYTGTGFYGKRTRDRLKDIISELPSADFKELRNEYFKKYGEAVPLLLIEQVLRDKEKNGIQQKLDI